MHCPSKNTDALESYETRREAERAYRELMKSKSQRKAVTLGKRRKSL